ncbi:ATP-binding protein [Nonomuraea sp. NPDC050556]|uniref:ATP-binding protein n=1 Tax=Nonomuraea sp. NPDC050556 TaxID=3364369 RepID=UPI0037B9C254
MRLPTGFRARLVITFTLVAVAASVLVAGIGYELAKAALIQRTEDSAIALVTRELTRIDFPIGYRSATDSDPSHADMQKLASSLNGSGRYVAIVNDAGDPGYNMDPLTIDDVPADLQGRSKSYLTTQRVVLRDELWLIVGAEVYTQPPETPIRTGLRVYVFFPLRDDEAQLADLRFKLAQGGALVLVIALAVALLSARRVLLPVRRLSAAAQALGKGELDTRLPVHGHDELAELTARFNDAAAALEVSVTELRSLEAMSRRFVADVSHELRTPLTAMTAVADMLSEEAERLPDAPAQAVRLVLHEVERLRELVEHLIEVSRFDAGTATLNVERVNVAETISDCLEVRGWTGRVKVNVQQNMEFILDPRRFDVILANLVGNALKHGAPPVVVAARRTQNGLEVKVRDYGKGIPMEAMNHVFDRFFKAGTGRERSQGSGLGLSIARSNAQLHGGSISVRQQRPGTLFTVWLPHR